MESTQGALRTAASVFQGFVLLFLLCAFVLVIVSFIAWQQRLGPPALWQWFALGILLDNALAVWVVSVVLRAFAQALDRLDQMARAAKPEAA